jgi:hypothetical protein
MHACDQTEVCTGSTPKQHIFLTDNCHSVVMVNLSFALLGAASLLAGVCGQEVDIGTLSGGLPPGKGPPLPSPVRILPTLANLKLRTVAFLCTV